MEKKLIYCTLFDQFYLDKGLALYYSLKETHKDFVLWVLCLTPKCYEILEGLALDKIRLIKLIDLEKTDSKLFQAKNNRSVIEYYFTLAPVLPLFILQHNPEITSISYVDADIYFFSDMDEIYNEIGENSIGIIENRFYKNPQALLAAGQFNVGFIFFRNDPEGIKCLRWWREKCFEWCYEKVEKERFADQKYLDKFPQIFSNVKIISHKGANLAPWNIRNYSIKQIDGKFYVGKQKLVFFHFHCLRNIWKGLYFHNLRNFKVSSQLPIIKNIFRKYIRVILKMEKLIPVECHKPAHLRFRNLGARLSQKKQRLVRIFEILKLLLKIFRRLNWFYFSPK
ncbi:MAG: glycosyl transferase [Candidatus Riflebacteria bacterium]|nr:glycosyl transferase [Candidatus Riflebacteria bacterium]